MQKIAITKEERAETQGSKLDVKLLEKIQQNTEKSNYVYTSV